MSLDAQTNLLIVDGGAVFAGGVEALAGSSNTIELTATGGAGTLSGLSSAYQNFGTVTIDAGANWTITGSTAGIDAASIGGFTPTDTIDLTDLSVSSGEIASLDQSTDVVSIFAADGTTLLGTVQLAGNLGAYGVGVASDGRGGTDLTAHDLIQDISTPVGAVVLDPNVYANPVTVTATGSVSAAGQAVVAATAWTIVNQGSITGWYRRLCICRRAAA